MKRTRLTIETESLLILQGRGAQRAWCPKCAAEVEMVALDTAAVISNLKSLELERWFNSGDLHHLQAGGGSALICLHSLLARVRSTNAG